MLTYEAMKSWTEAMNKGYKPRRKRSELASVPTPTSSNHEIKISSNSNFITGDPAGQEEGS